MFWNEWIKLVTNKVFLFLFVLFLLLNGYYLYWSMELDREADEPGPERYNRAVLELQTLDDNGKLEAVSRKLEEISLEFEELGSEFPPDDLYREQFLYQELLEELKQHSGFSQAVDAILANAGRRMETAKETSYAYRQAEKTRQRYERLTGIEPVFFPAKGLEYLLDDPAADCSTLFLVLIGAFLITLAERQKQLSILPKTTRYGRGAHSRIKAAVLGTAAAAVTVILFLERFWIIDQSYPFSDLGVPVQSVFPYCALKVSVFGYLAIYLFLKILFVWLVMSVFYLIGSVCRNTLLAIALLAGLTGVSAVCYLAVSPSSYLAFFHNWNPVAFSQIQPLLARYQSVNVLGYAVDKTGFCIFLWCFLSVFFCVLAGKLSAVQDELKASGNRDFTFFPKRTGSVNRFAHEAYKVFAVQKVFFLLLLAGIAAYAVYVPVSEKDGTLVDAVYHHYSEAVAGKYSGKIDAVIERNLETVEEQIEDAAEEKRNFLNIQNAVLMQMKEYAAYLSQRENSYYIDNRGFTILTGGDADANRRHLVTKILMYAFAVICFVQALSVDYQNGEIRIIRSTPGGRRNYRKDKAGLGCLILLFLFAVFWLPELIQLIGTFGTADISAPAYSLQHLADVSSRISIREYLVFQYAGILLALAVLMAASYLVEKKIKNGTISILILLAFVEIPLFVRLAAG